MKKFYEKVKSTVSRTYIFSDLNGEDIFGIFCVKELQKTNQRLFRDAKVIKRKGGKLYVKWKGYDDLLHSWIDKKDIL